MKKTQPQLLLEAILPEMQEAREEYEAHKREQEMDECPHDENDHGICLNCGKDIMDDLVGWAEMQRDAMEDR